jgi:hypothetical protein
MSDPNSRLTRLRRRAARIVEPRPDPGEAWCTDCTLNDGRTLVVSADGMREHAERHVREEPAGMVSLQATWPGES